MRAVLVVHGMGQQVRFEGLDQIAQGLLRETGGGTRKPVARTVRIGDETYQRLELFLPLPDAGEREVHVYEVYWAPITEGEVSLRDVTSFLIGAAFNGLRNFRGALRYTFGRAHTIRPSLSAAFALLSAFGVLLALVAMNGILLAARGAQRARARIRLRSAQAAPHGRRARAPDDSRGVQPRHAGPADRSFRSGVGEEADGARAARQSVARARRRACKVSSSSG